MDLLEPWLEGWKRKSKDKVGLGEGGEPGGEEPGGTCGTIVLLCGGTAQTWR